MVVLVTVAVVVTKLAGLRALASFIAAAGAATVVIHIVLANRSLKRVRRP